MQQNSSYKGWSYYRSPSIPFHKLQYSPLVYQNLNLFISNETIDFQQITNLNRVNRNEQVSVLKINDNKEADSYTNAKGKHSERIITSNLDLKRENVLLQNIGTPCLKPQENIINSYCLKNDDFQKFQSSIRQSSCINKSSIFTSSLIKNIKNSNSVESKKKCETKIIIQEEQKSTPFKEDSFNDNVSLEEENIEDEDWTPTGKKQLLCNKRNKEKSLIIPQFNTSIDMDLLKKCVYSSLEIRTKLKSNKEITKSLRKFSAFLYSKEKFEICLKKLKSNRNFTNLKKKLNENLLKILFKYDDEDSKPLNTLIKGNKEKIKQYLNFCDNPRDIYNYLIKLIEEEIDHLRRTKEDISDSYLERLAYCDSIYNHIRSISKTSNSLHKPSNHIDESLDKKKIKIKKNIEQDLKKFICSVCSGTFINGQALGGHMSRTHPLYSEKYKLKKEIRQSRTKFRQALNEAKTELLTRYNLSYAKLCKGKENKKIMKEIIYANKDEYRIILLEKKKMLNIKSANEPKTEEKTC